KRSGNLLKKNRRWLVPGVLLGAALLLWCFGASMWRRVTSTAAPSPGDRIPEPPPLEATNADPAVARAIQAARTAVTQSPHAAEPWGRLGMILKAHGFPAEANTCFIQAEQLDPREPRWAYHQAIEVAERDPEAAITKLEKTISLFGADCEAPR